MNWPSVRLSAACSPGTPQARPLVSSKMVRHRALCWPQTRDLASIIIIRNRNGSGSLGRAQATLSGPSVLSLLCNAATVAHLSTNRNFDRARQDLRPHKSLKKSLSISFPLTLSLSFIQPLSILTISIERSESFSRKRHARGCERHKVRATPTAAASLLASQPARRPARGCN